MLSIIIPVYNIEQYLPDTIQSVIDQQYTDWELILVNDGSSDNSKTICEEYQRKDSRIKVLNQQNSGVSWATYNGYKVATGEYIAFVDHDDILLHDLFSDLISRFEEGIDISCCSRIDLYNKDISSYKWDNSEIITKVTGCQAVENLLRKNDYDLQLPLWGRVYRKSFLDTIDFLKYSESLPVLFMVDIFIMPQILFKARNVVYTNKVMYIHREVRNSISRSGRINDFYLEQIEAFPILLHFYKNNNLISLYQDTLKQYLKTTLMRLWYKINSDKTKYDNSKTLLETISKKFDKYYPEIELEGISNVDYLNFKFFARNKNLWSLTIGNLYFRVIRFLKYSFF